MTSISSYHLLHLLPETEYNVHLLPVQLIEPKAIQSEVPHQFTQLSMPDEEVCQVVCLSFTEFSLHMQADNILPEFIPQQETGYNNTRTELVVSFPHLSNHLQYSISTSVDSTTVHVDTVCTGQFNVYINRALIS